MAYDIQPNHKFFAVHQGGCNPIAGYAHEKRMKSWIAQEYRGNIEILTRVILMDRRNKNVAVINCISQKQVIIKASQLGGACDPSTERFHSM